MKKLFILILVCSAIYGVYYGFTKIVEKENKEVKENLTIKNEESETIIDTELEAINSAYISYCLTYVSSVENKIVLDVMTGNEIPKVITDVNYVTSTKMPVEMNLNITEKGIVNSGTIIYDKVICNYENGVANIEKR